MCRNGDEGAHLTGKGKRCDLKPLASVGGGDRQLIGGKTPTKSGASTVPLLLPAHCANVRQCCCCLGNFQMHGNVQDRAFTPTCCIKETNTQTVNGESKSSHTRVWHSVFVVCRVEE